MPSASFIAIRLSREFSLEVCRESAIRSRFQHTNAFSDSSVTRPYVFAEPPTLPARRRSTESRTIDRTIPRVLSRLECITVHYYARNIHAFNPIPRSANRAARVVDSASRLRAGFIDRSARSPRRVAVPISPSGRPREKRVRSSPEAQTRRTETPRNYSNRGRGALRLREGTE